MTLCDTVCRHFPFLHLDSDDMYSGATVCLSHGKMIADL